MAKQFTTKPSIRLLVADCGFIRLRRSLNQDFFLTIWSDLNLQWSESYLSLLPLPPKLSVAWKYLNQSIAYKTIISLKYKPSFFITTIRTAAWSCGAPSTGAAASLGCGSCRTTSSWAAPRGCWCPAPLVPVSVANLWVVICSLLPPFLNPFSSYISQCKDFQIHDWISRSVKNVNLCDLFLFIQNIDSVHVCMDKKPVCVFRNSLPMLADRFSHLNIMSTSHRSAVWSKCVYNFCIKRVFQFKCKWKQT